jgi:prepilin-type N-terminal cleavage/methylation domain-containing protein
MRSADPQRGFTLIELMVTLVVSMIGTAGLLHLYVTMSRATKITTRQLEASNFAEGALEDLRGLSSADLIDQYGALPIEEELDDELGRNDQPYGVKIFADLVGAEPMALIRYRVEVTWTEDGALPGAEGGIYDHTTSLEVLRTLDEFQ